MEQEQAVERKAREDREKLRSAKEQGLLDPLIEYLDREIKRLSKPLEPGGAEYPFLIVRKEGDLSGIMRVKQKIEGLTTISPDEAENTEDGHG